MSWLKMDLRFTVKTPLPVPAARTSGPMVELLLPGFAEFNSARCCGVRLANFFCSGDKPARIPSRVEEEEERSLKVVKEKIPRERRIITARETIVFL